VLDAPCRRLHGISAKKNPRSLPDGLSDWVGQARNAGAEFLISAPKAKQREVRSGSSEADIPNPALRELQRSKNEAPPRPAANLDTILALFSQTFIFAIKDHAVTPFLTSKENIVIDIAFGWLGESRINRAREEYMDVASRIPNLTALHDIVNDTLGRMAEAGYAPFEICYFKRGDRGHWYETFPKSVSLETVRKAWLKSGMKELKAEHRKMKRLSKRNG